MRLPDFSVARPVFTTMVTLIVVVLGAVSVSRIQVDLLPEIERPTLSIRTDYDGADPIVVERLVTQIVEEIVATVNGVEEITSTSSEGRSSVRLRFVWGTDIDEAAIEVRSVLEDEISELPEEIDRPQVRTFDISSFPVVIMGVSSHVDPIELTNIIENDLRYRFSSLPGVAQMDLWGGFPREIRVELLPDRINALGIPFNRIVDALLNANLDLPTGKLEEGRYAVTLRAPAEFQSVDEVKDMVVTVIDGMPIQLKQIANIRDTYEEIDEYERVNGQRGIRVALRKQSKANTSEVSRLILEEIEQAKADFPQIDIVPVINQGNFIDRSLRNVANSVAFGGVLAVFVLLFFLRSLRSTIVITLAIPISIIATLAMVYFGGMTLNLMTLGGLALGVGMMVDSSIVVLENIFRRMNEHDEDPVMAARNGTTEVGGAIIASTITTLSIFLPLIFIQGVSGILFRDLAYVIGFSLICSLLVSLTVVPMLASKFIRSASTSDDETPPGVLGRLSRVAERFFTGLSTSYREVIGDVLHWRWTTIGVATAIFAGSLFLVPLLGTEFLPPSDEGEVRITGELEVGTKLELVNELCLKMEEIVIPAVPEIRSYVASAESAGDEPSEASIRMSLVPASERERSNVEIASDLRQRLEGQIPGMDIRVRAPQGQFLLQRVLGTEEGLTVEVLGFNFERLGGLANQVMDAIRDVPGITDLNSSRDEGVPQYEVVVNRAKIADVGLTVRDVTQSLSTAIAGSEAGEYREEGESYRIFVQLRGAKYRSLDEVLALNLATPSGEQVALRNLVSTRDSRGPVLIERKDQQRIVTVNGNVAGRDLGSVAADVEARVDTIPRESGYQIRLAGNYEEQQRSFRELLVSLGLALALVYMVLACQYESLRSPVIVMAAVPLAVVGVVVTLFLTNTTLNVQSFIGCIMLVGIVVNNAILLVDQADHLRLGGESVREAVAEAGRRRLRPILMTTTTTILGLLPLALGIGEGADAQAPLARAVVGGLTSSTLITLLFIPAVYSLMYRERAAS